jgi:hypothetical protein
MDSNSLPANGRDKDSALTSGMVNNRSFAGANKHFEGAISQVQQQDESWLSSDVAMVYAVCFVYFEKADVYILDLTSLKQSQVNEMHQGLLTSRTLQITLEDRQLNAY